MEGATKYDAIIIGSGQAGTPLASALAQAGRKTALIERVHVGGTCVNEGCTPTKTMVASARAAQPVLPGFGSISALDNFSIMDLDTVPERLIVLGGGYIGLEFGQMFRRFGSKVTVIHSRPQLLAREDPDVAEEIEKILRED